MIWKGRIAGRYVANSTAGQTITYWPGSDGGSSLSNGSSVAGVEASAGRTAMSGNAAKPLLDYVLSADELAWVQAVYEDFVALRAASARQAQALSPKEALRAVLAKPEHALPTPMDLSGDGPWRGGRNHHGRLVTAVFLHAAELHRHERSRTDQFPMYVNGEADAFSLSEGEKPVLTPVVGGAQFSNKPNAPHAFLPKVGKPIPPDWEIAFIAITPRNILEDTQSVSAEVRAAYEKVVGMPAPRHGVN